MGPRSNGAGGLEIMPNGFTNNNQSQIDNFLSSVAQEA
jgi:hypothetical protein